MEISEKLIAIRTFMLTDHHHRDYYYGVGDEFHIMNVLRYTDHITITLQSSDSGFQWTIDYKDFSDFSYYLVSEKKFVYVMRKMKLDKLRENDASRG